LLQVIGTGESPYYKASMLVALVIFAAQKVTFSAHKKRKETLKESHNIIPLDFELVEN